MEALSVGQRMATYNHVDVQFLKEVNGFDFAPSRYKWLARTCWWSLEKLKALKPHHITVRDVVYTEKHQNMITSALIEAINNTADISFDRLNEYCIVIGAETVYALTGEYGYRVSHPHLILQAGSVYHRGGEYTNTFHDLPVHVVPNMQGLLILPKAIIEKEECIKCT